MNCMSKYRIFKDIIGEGYFSLVFKAIEKSTGQEVAFKTIKKEFTEDPTYQEYIYRFKREIRIMKELSDFDNIISVLDYNTDKIRPWYTMPMADYNLDNYIKSNTALLLIDRVQIFKSILNGIKYAHSKEKLHRDLSPTNILLFSDNNLKVVISDFGLARDFESLSKITNSTSSYGHFYYTAPEQLDALRNSTVKSDIYSLGAILYFILTGDTPLNRKPTEFDIVINKCMDQAPGNRFNSVVELEEELNLLIKILQRKNDISGIIPLSEFFNNLKHQEIIDKSKYLDLHKLLQDGLYEDHLYYDYVEPIITHLRGELLENYNKIIGLEIKHFLNKFIQKLHEMYGTTGWPFKQLDAIGDFLYELFYILDSENLRIICFSEMFDIAFESDQVHVQYLIINILSNKMSTNTENNLSLFITKMHPTYVNMLYEIVKSEKINPIIKKVILDNRKIN